MKKVISILLIVAMLFCFAACGKQDEPTNRLDEIKARGYIEMATEPYFAPYEFIDPSKTGDDKYLGYDIELAKAIAAKIGVELRIVPLEFTAVQAGIADGKYDMAVSAISYSPTRAETFNLSKGYEYSESGYGFIVREADKDKYNSIEDLKDAVVATQSGSVQEQIFLTQITEKGCKEFKRTSAMTDAYLAVQENLADVCVCSKTSAALYAEANGGLVVPEFTFEIDPEWNAVVIACPKEGTDELMAVINDVIQECKDKGLIKQWNDIAVQQAKELGIE